MTSGNSPSDREQLLLELENLEAFFCDATHSNAMDTPAEDIPTLKVEVPILRDVVLQPTLQTKANVNSLARGSSPYQTAQSNPTQIPASAHLSESAQNPNPDAAVLPPIDPLPSAQPLTQSAERSSPHNHTLAFLDSISASSDKTPLKNTHKDNALDEEDLMYLTVDDDEVDEILGDVMAEIIPIIERKLRKKLRKRLKRMLSTQA